MGFLIAFLVLSLVVLMMYLVSLKVDTKYRCAKVKHKFKEGGINCKFIVVYIDGYPKSKTIKVTEEVYEKYNVDDYVTFFM